MIGGGRPLILRENLTDTDPPADFRSIFVLIASAVTPSEKSSIKTNRKFTARFPMNLTIIHEHRCPKLPIINGSKRKASNIEH